MSTQQKNLPLETGKPAGRMSLAQVFEKFVAIYLPSKYASPVTCRGYKYDVREWLEESQITHVDELDLQRIQNGLDTGKNFGRKSTTRQRKIAAVKVFLVYLETVLQVLPADFSSGLIWPKVVKDDPRFLTEEQYQKILAEADGNARDRAMLEVLLQTGIRLSELTRLKVEDVDLPHKPSPSVTSGSGVLRVKRTGKTKALALNYKACQAVQAYLPVRPRSAHPQLFLTKYETPMSNRAVQKVFKKYAVAAGISWAHVDTFRTTHIAQHIAKKTDLKTVQEHAGHHSLKTTTYYAELVNDARIKDMQEHAL